eukprot:TRINITY_DN1944_c0_g1_i1.p1 TRINITY_DN1944_c0_g1~~TRINITY_DN1944_c0_g1_i1.p1  ORF type:complete len:354 (+),score=75.70 TRINITY_DN1944_c0_g1_i1:131-1192(+)
MLGRLSTSSSFSRSSLSLSPSPSLSVSPSLSPTPLSSVSTTAPQHIPSSLPTTSHLALHSLHRPRWPSLKPYPARVPRSGSTLSRLAQAAVASRALSVSPVQGEKMKPHVGRHRTEFDGSEAQWIHKYGAHKGPKRIPPPIEEPKDEGESHRLRLSDRPFVGLPYPPRVNINHMDPFSFKMMDLHQQLAEKFGRELNVAVQESVCLNYTLEEIILKRVPGISDRAVHMQSHDTFFNSLGSFADREPDGAVGKAIVRSFGSFGRFKTLFSKACNNFFGSGFVWLALDTNCPDNTLHIISCGAGQHPMYQEGFKGIFCLDLWEHAFYEDYRDDREMYVDEFWMCCSWIHANSFFL